SKRGRVGHHRDSVRHPSSRRRCRILGHSKRQTRPGAFVRILPPDGGLAVGAPEALMPCSPTHFVACLFFQTMGGGLRLSPSLPRWIHRFIFLNPHESSAPRIGAWCWPRATAPPRKLPRRWRNCAALTGIPSMPTSDAKAVARTTPRI